MNALVELIKRIGIFMIAAQAVIHFTPGQKYEKYIRLLVGMMILLQFVMSLHRMAGGVETDWSAQMADMEGLFDMEGMDDKTVVLPSAADSVMSNLENEIKSKLNDEIAEEGYAVSSVRVSMKTYGGTGSREYALEKIRVVVYGRTVFPDGRADKNAGNAGNGGSGENGETGGIEKNEIEKVRIEKIDIGSTSDSGRTVIGGMEEGGPYGEDTEEIAEQLRERFCGVLGIDEENMEVSVYGTNEKTDR